MMKHWLRISVTLILMVGGLLIFTHRSQAAAPDEPGDIFKSKCAMCHGPEGKGISAIKTPDFTDPKWQASIKDAEIKETITNGKKDTMMKGFGDTLSEDEIASMVKYIRSLDSSKK